MNQKVAKFNRLLFLIYILYSCIVIKVVLFNFFGSRKNIKTNFMSRTVAKFEVLNIHVYISQMEYIPDEIPVQILPLNIVFENLISWL